MDEYITKTERNVLLPIIKREFVNSIDTDYQYYLLRMTPFDKYSMEELEIFIKTITTCYIITQEVSKKDKDHYHIVLVCEVDEEPLRALIRDFLKKYFTEAPKRGDANKQYNLQVSKDFQQSIIYILKDGGLIKSGEAINADEIQKYKKQSYQKYSKAEFQKEFEALKVKYKGDITSLSDMMEGVVKLKAKYRQPINMMYVYQVCLSFFIHNNEQYAEQYVQEFLSKR